MKNFKSILFVTIACVLAALPFALTGCGDGSIREDEWRGAFNENNFTNCTMEMSAYTDLLGFKFEYINMLVKSEENKAYVKASMPGIIELPTDNIEAYVEVDGDTSYAYLYDGDAEKWYRSEADMRDFDFGVDIEGYNVFADMYSSFTYDKENRVYTAENLTIGMGENQQVFGTVAVTIEKGHVTNVTYTQTVSNSESGIPIDTPMVYEMKFYNYGATKVNIPTDYVDRIVSSEVTERQWKNALSAEAFENATTYLDDLTRVTALADSYRSFTYDPVMYVYFSNDFNGYDKVVLTFDGGRLVEVEFTSTDNDTSEQIVEMFTFDYIA